MKRIVVMSLCALLAAVLLSGAAHARPIVRAVVSPRQAVVGSPMRLRVTVLVETWFTSAPDYPSFEVAGLVVREPADNSFNVRERIGGVTYAGIVREYLLYPQRAARYVLDGQVVHVHYAHPDTRKPVDIARNLAPVRFEATVPAAAQELDPFLATRRLVLEQSVDGDLDAPAVGDAIERAVTVTVNDLPSMFIPPLLAAEHPHGLRGYASSPETEDVPGREAGRSIGRRMESVTYMIEEPGDYVLPAVRLRWWNRRTGAIETAEVPAFAFAVPTPPAATPPPDSTDAAAGRAVGLVPLVVFALLVALALAGRRRLRRVFEAWRASRARRADSEPVRFRQLSRAIGRAEPDVIYRRLKAWLQSIDGVSAELASLSTRPGCGPLAGSVSALERNLYAAGEYPVDRKARAALRAALPQARRVLCDTAGTSGTGRTGAALPALPTLNPGGARR